MALPPFTGGSLIILTSFARNEMNQSISKISEKLLQRWIQKMWNKLNLNTYNHGYHGLKIGKCSLLTIAYLESFQKDVWSSLGTTSVAFRIRAATTASTIYKEAGAMICLMYSSALQDEENQQISNLDMEVRFSAPFHQRNWHFIKHVTPAHGLHSWWPLPIYIPQVVWAGPDNMYYKQCAA